MSVSEMVCFIVDCVGIKLTYLTHKKVRESIKVMRQNISKWQELSNLSVNV